MPELEIALTVNGRAVRWHLEPGETLLEALHAHYLKGTKLICGTGDCCGCGILLDGRSINSCCMLAAQADGSDLLTIEGLAQDENSIQSRKLLPKRGPHSVDTVHPVSS